MGNETVGEDNLEVYTPDIGESQEIGIDETTTSYSPRLNKLKEGETIQVKLNEKAIKWRISHDLYKDFKSGVRELFQNEARACRQARTKYNAKPKIEVRINPNTKSLTIQGIDSLGISESVFDNVLRVLGVSGNTDGGNEVGQFGMGFASYTTLSDIILVETWYRENRDDGSEQRYAFLGDNGIDFKILPEPELDTFGTKLSMTYNVKVEERGIIDMITECAKFCGVPVSLIVDGTWDTYHEYGHEGIYELTTYKSLPDCLKIQFQERCVQDKMYDEDGINYDSDTRVGFYKEVHIDNEDYEFFGIIAIAKSKTGDYTNRMNSIMNYHLLATVPIEINFRPKGFWTSYALNIKNERKFMPTADRDRLTQEAEEEIQNAFNEIIPTYFTELGLETVSDYLSTLDKPIYDQWYYFESLIDKEVYENSQRVISVLGKRFSLGGTRSYRTLKSMIASGSTMIKLKALRGDYIARLGTVFDDKICFRYKESDEGGYEENYNKTLDLLEEAGVIFGEEYIKEHKIKPLTKKERNTGNKIANSEKAIRLYNAGYRHHHEVDGERAFGLATSYRRSIVSTKVGQVNEKMHDNMIVYDLKGKDKIEFDEIKQKLYSTEASYVFMKNIKGLDEDILKFSEYLVDIDNHKFILVNGKQLRVKSMIEAVPVIMGDHIAINKLCDNKVVKGYEHCVVVKDQNELFDLEFALKKHGKYTSRGYQSNCSESDLIEKSSGIDVEDITMYCNDAQKKIIYSKLPNVKNKLSDGMFRVFFRAVASRPYDFDKILAELDEDMKE